MTVSEIMTSNPTCAPPDMPVNQVAQMMRTEDCGIIPVVENTQSNRLQGVITDRDLAVRVVADGLDANSTLVGHCMTTGVQSVQPDDLVQKCEELMEFHQVRRIPVVNENGALIGIVAQADLARARPDREVAELVKDVSKPYVG